VRLAVFAAAALAKANMWRAGFEAVRIAAAGFIVPSCSPTSRAPRHRRLGTIALATATATSA